MAKLYHGTTLEYHNQRVKETGSYSHPQRNKFLRLFLGERRNNKNNHLEDIYFTGCPWHATDSAIKNAKKHDNAIPIILVSESDLISEIGKTNFKHPYLIEDRERVHLRLIRGKLPTGSYKIINFKSIENAEKIMRSITNEGVINTKKLEKRLEEILQN